MAGLGEVIAGSIWARELSPQQRLRVLAETTERSVSEGGFVCRRGEAVEYWIGVVDGLVKISSVSPEGKAVTFTGVPPGGWFGEGSLLKTDPWKYDAVALRPSQVALVPRATFAWLLDSSITFNRFLLLQLNERLSQFIGMLETDRLLDPDARIARCLAMLFNPHLYPGVERRLQLSQEEIGYFSGISRQRANQALRALEAAGLLKLEYGSVTVLEVEGLRRYGS
ncbi:MAG: Crp/Fnr family transcriptional regulator [Betaproteobacteria bacterium RIFCSPLOWO2_02_FULL_67_19]|nr:MAG: Crp/Fnr family transcriptional regulator [Betaproteobacteria bacterium RIFCSPLOWO2_02_FULL_67_19]